VRTGVIRAWVCENWGYKSWVCEDWVIRASYEDWVTRAGGVRTGVIRLVV
jgi:hypothetical protein